MRWDAVIEDWLTRIEGNSDVQAVLGTNLPNLYMAGERDFEVPSMEWQLISPGMEGEVYEMALVQIDMWTRTASALVQLARGLRKAAHHDLPITVGGVDIWSRLDGGRPMQAPEDGIFGLGHDFHLEYLRSKWT